MADVSCLISAAVLALEQLRTDEKFDEFWDEMRDRSEKYNIDQPELPRKRKLPRRFDDSTIDYEFKDVKSYYRKQYFEVIDVTVTAMKARFNSPGFTAVTKLESCILNAAKNAETTREDVDHICDTYSELSRERLQLHFDMFADICRQKQVHVANIQDIVNVFNTSAVCDMLPEMFKVIKIFLTISVTTCIAERSFSLLRRLKTFLRSTVGQARMNHVAILSCYREATDTIDLQTIYTEFISRNELRRKTFAV
jgi:hypothetical protein